jgi:uncharacterized protein (TIGR03118 family)
MTLKLTLTLGLTLLALPALAGGTGKPATSSYDLVLLDSDQAGVAQNQDPDLVNAWGLSLRSGATDLWVSDNGTGLSTVYNFNTGVKEFGVTVAGGVPTGTVGQDTLSGFNISEGGRSGPAYFLFDSEAGLITGWSPVVDGSNAVVAVDNSAKHSVYKGLALDQTDKLLYAADFHNNQVQVYDTHFHLVTKFTDSSLPKRFAPFNVAFINGQVYVAFAKRVKGGDDEIDKLGLGYVDIFDKNGNLVKHLIANGPLDAPWAMAIAPAGFGSFAGDLLVGNFGNGWINVFDPSTGAQLGTLSNKRGKPIKIDGLWGLLPGPNSNVTFAAGPNDESHGLLGQIVVH